MSLRAAILLALVAAGCGSSTTQLGTTIRNPVAIAFFDGVTTKRPGVVYRYMAVAAYSGNELILVDPADDAPVVGPGLVFPLSVPTLPGPTFLAAASLGDGLPGLLAVGGYDQSLTGRQAPIIDIVATWNELTTLAPPAAFRVNLAEELGIGDAQILSLVAMPVLPQVPGQPYRACIIASLSGKRLAVVTYERDPLSTSNALRRVPGPAGQAQLVTTTAAATGAPASFDALALDLEPVGAMDAQATTRRLFAATLDPLADKNGSPVYGVAQITASFDATTGSPLAPWPVVGLDALAPTRLVAAQLVSERDLSVEPATGYLAMTPEQLDRKMRLEVFAVLDEGDVVEPGKLPRPACGPQAPIDCGIVTLVPDDPTRNGIAADPVGELPYRAPMRVPGYALAMTAAAPRSFLYDPSNPATAAFNGDPAEYAPNAPDSPPTSTTDGRYRVMTIAPSTGLRDASAVLAVASSEGRIYMYDVSRFAAGNDLSILRGTSKAGVASGSVSVQGPLLPVKTVVTPDPNNPDNLNYPVLTVWDDRDNWLPSVNNKATAKDPVSGLLTVTAAAVTNNIFAPPGYAQDDTWQVRWHGALPGLASRAAVVGANADGTFWVAAQARGTDAAGRPIWVPSIDATAPEFGARVGDFVDLDVPADLCPGHLTDTSGNPLLGRLRAQVVGFLPPVPDYPPGAQNYPLSHPQGALAIDRVQDPATGAQCPNAIVAPPGTGGTVGTTAEVVLTVRVNGIAVSGARFGYAGRAVISGTMEDPSSPTDQASVEAQAFRLRWEDEKALQAQIDSAPTPELKRPFEERLAIARKARRNFYPSDDVCGSGTGATPLHCDDWPDGWNPTNGVFQTPFSDSTGANVYLMPEREVLRFRLAAFCRPTVFPAPCVPVASMKEDTGLVFSTQRGVSEWSRRPLVGGSYPRTVQWVDKSRYNGTLGTYLVAGFTDNQVIDYSPNSSTAVTGVIH